jgi:fluoride exporter
MLKLILIFVGSGLGGILRYAVQGWVQRLVDVSFPLGTLAVNVAGCFIIGVLAAAFSGPILIREEYRIGLTVGIIGGFTTFSTFGLETFNLANEGQLRLALANVVASCLLGFVAVLIGYRIAERWLGV